MIRERFDATDAALTKAEGLSIALGRLAWDGNLLTTNDPEAHALQTLIGVLGEAINEAIELHAAELPRPKVAV